MLTDKYTHSTDTLIAIQRIPVWGKTMNILRRGKKKEMAGRAK